MRRFIIASLLAAFALPLTSSSQVVSLKESRIEHNDAMRSCWTAQLPAAKDNAKDAWADFLKDNYDIKLKGLGLFANKDFLSAEEIQAEALSDMTLNFYTAFEQGATEEMTTMSAFISFGYDVYASRDEYPQTYQTLHNMVERFLHSFLPQYYTETIEEKEEQVNDLRDDIEDLRKDIVSYEKDIEDLKKKIEDSNKELETLQTELEFSSRELEEKREAFEKVRMNLKSLGRADR